MYRLIVCSPYPERILEYSDYYSLLHPPKLSPRELKEFLEYADESGLRISSTGTCSRKALFHCKKRRIRNSQRACSEPREDAPPVRCVEVVSGVAQHAAACR